MFCVREYVNVCPCVLCVFVSQRILSMSAHVTFPFCFSEPTGGPGLSTISLSLSLSPSLYSVSLSLSLSVPLLSHSPSQLLPHLPTVLCVQSNADKHSVYMQSEMADELSSKNRLMSSVSACSLTATSFHKTQPRPLESLSLSLLLFPVVSLFLIKGYAIQV